MKANLYFTLILLLGIYFSHGLPEFTTTSWGNVNPNQEMLADFVFKQPIDSYTPLNETITFPYSAWWSAPPMTIEGIEARNLASIQPIITFLKGGIGAPFVTINVIAPAGREINCAFKFFVSRSSEDVPRIIANYIGAEFDIGSMT